MSILHDEGQWPRNVRPAATSDCSSVCDPVIASAYAPGYVRNSIINPSEIRIILKFCKFPLSISTFSVNAIMCRARQSYNLCGVTFQEDSLIETESMSPRHFTRLGFKVGLIGSQGLLTSRRQWIDYMKTDGSDITFTSSMVLSLLILFQVMLILTM